MLLSLSSLILPFTQVFSFKDINEKGNLVLNEKSEPPAKSGMRAEKAVGSRKKITAYVLSVIE